MFQVKCYALTANDDSVWRRKIENESEHFCDVSALQVQWDIARFIHSDASILINLNGVHQGARGMRFSHSSLSPVQC
ncbi:unnamed protein product, partial [Ascophyllum nodosum]